MCYYFCNVILCVPKMWFCLNISHLADQLENFIQHLNSTKIAHIHEQWTRGAQKADFVHLSSSCGTTFYDRGRISKLGMLKMKVSLCEASQVQCHILWGSCITVEKTWYYRILQSNGACFSSSIVAVSTPSLLNHSLLHWPLSTWCSDTIIVLKMMTTHTSGVFCELFLHNLRSIQQSK